MPKHQSKRVLSFGGFRVDVDERMLLDENDSTVPLTPKAFDTLLFLVENNGRVVTRDELMTQVWPDSFVEENNLAQNISTLRKVLGPAGATLIQTVPKRGYRFVADVEEAEAEVPQIILRERTRARVVIEEVDDAAISTTGPPLLKSEPGLLGTGLDQPPQTMYARSGEVNIAYQVVGEAPLDLVFVMGWVSHLEYA